MNAKEKLIWLATNANETMDNVELCRFDTWRVMAGDSLAFILLCELRLTQAEIEKRNPGLEVVEWYGREPKYSGRPLPEGQVVADGWLLRKNVEKNGLPGKMKNCPKCVYYEDLGNMFYCQNQTPGCHFIPKQAESKPVKVGDKVCNAQCYGEPDDPEHPCRYQCYANKSCNNCGRRSKVSPDACNSIDNCHNFSLWMPEFKAPADKPVRVKAWVRWPKDTEPDAYAVDRISKERVVIDGDWQSVNDLIKDGCEHTDTPDIEESWTKIGG